MDEYKCPNLCCAKINNCVDKQQKRRKKTPRKMTFSRITFLPLLHSLWLFFLRVAMYWGAQVKWVFAAAPWDLHQQTQFSLSAARLTVRKEAKWVSCDNDNNERNEASIAPKTSHTLRNDHFSLAHDHISPPDVTAIWLFSTKGKHNSSRDWLGTVHSQKRRLF